MKDNLTINFTDWNTVVFSTGETLSIDKFFQILEDNIESDEYDVCYKENKFYIRYNNYDYEVMLDEEEKNNLKKNILSPLTRKLLSLSKIQTMIDIQNGNSDLIINDVMDNDAKIVYLNKLKKSMKFNLLKYVRNLIHDVKVSKSDMKDFIKKHIYPFKGKDNFDFNSEDLGWLFLLPLCIGLLTAIIGIIPAALLDNGLFVLYGGLLPQAYWVIFPITFLCEQIKNRTRRLRGHINDKKAKKNLINSLTKSINEKQMLIEEQKKETKVLEERLDEELKYDITKMLSKFIDDLKEINSHDRQELKKEIREILLMYNEIISHDNMIHDNEIYYYHPELINKLMELKLKIDDAIRKSPSDTRIDEIKYLEEKLDSIYEENGNALRKILRNRLNNNVKK